MIPHLVKTIPHLVKTLAALAAKDTRLKQFFRIGMAPMASTILLSLKIARIVPAAG
jgi:hypothetical protein